MNHDPNPGPKRLMHKSECSFINAKRDIELPRGMSSLPGSKASMESRLLRESWVVFLGKGGLWGTRDSVYVLVPLL